MKRIYGLSERQIVKYFAQAKGNKSRNLKIQKDKKIGTGELLLTLLETRLDNVLFRSGLVPSRSIARQIVSHGHVTVNNQKINVPSYNVKATEVINIDSKATAIPVIKENLDKKIIAPSWITKKATVAKIIRLPERKEIDADIDEQLIIEFYSR